MPTTLTSVKCRQCSAELDLSDHFCYSCGWEVAPPCPICEERRFVLDPQVSSWCLTDTCRHVTPYCRLCNRCLAPSTDRCPVCAKLPVSLLPQHAGRVPGDTLTERQRYTELGEGETGTLTMVEAFPKPLQEVQSAFAAHGCLYAWEGRSDGNAVLHVVKSGVVEPSFPLSTEFFAPLPMPIQDRSAMLGRFAIVTRKHGFATIDLVTGETNEGMPKGKPIAQAGWLDQWVGWVRENASDVGDVDPKMQLWHVRQPLAKRWTPQATLLLTVDKASGIAPWGPLLLHERRVYWATRDAAVWSVELQTKTTEVQPREVVAPGDGCRRVWLCGVDKDVIIVREYGARAQVLRLASPTSSVELVDVRGPLSAIYASGNRLIVVGHLIFVYDTTTWQEIARIVRPPGAWIDSILAYDNKNNLVVYGLVKEFDDTDQPWSSLYRFSFDRIAPTLLWRDTVDALRIVSALPELLIAHRGGVLRREQNQVKAR